MMPKKIITTDPAADLPTFGRRRGRKMSALQSGLLDRLLEAPPLDLSRPPPPDVRDLFAACIKEVWLEIGFGGGEHLIWQARRNADVGFIGSEPFLDGVVKVLTAVEQDQIHNILLHPNDVRPVLRWLPKQSISRAFILFPDPWPKRKHLKRRLVSVQTLSVLASLMPSGSELRIATDIADYVRTTLLAIQAEGSFSWPASRPCHWRDRPEDWPETRYERKAIRAGRRCYYFSFVRK